MKNKKIIAIALILSAILALASCGGGNTDDNGTSGDSSTPTESTSSDSSSDSSSDEAVDSTDESASTGTVTAAEIGAAVEKEFGDDFIPNMEIDGSILDATYGVKSDWYSEMYGKVPMISANVDTFIAIKAKDGHLADIENALNDYADYYRKDAFKYPQDIQKANALKVYTKGDYAFFIMLGVPTDEVENMEDADQLKYYTEQNDRAVKVIDGLLG